MRLAPIVLAAAVLGGCGWDGPIGDVRVVDPTLPADGGEPAPAGDRAVEPAEAGGAADGVDAPAALPSGEAGGDGAAATASGDALAVPRTIAVVGDSLTVSAEEEIVDELTRRGFVVVAVEARESRRMASGSADLPSGVEAIEHVLGDVEPDLWVVALGTNDVGAQADATTFVADLRRALAAIPADAPVVWVDVWIRDRQEAAVAANSLIRDELARRVTATAIVDWYSHGTDDGIITGDGVHLTDAGQWLFARSIADRIDAMYRR